MNNWLCSGFEYPSEPMDRGKVIRTKEQMDAVENYGRYRDVDGDGIVGVNDVLDILSNFGGACE